MKQFYGMSQRGSLDEALQGLFRPQFIMLLSNNNQFEAHVAELEKRFPGKTAPLFREQPCLAHVQGGRFWEAVPGTALCAGA